MAAPLKMGEATMNATTLHVASSAGDPAAPAVPLERSNILIVDDRLDKRVVFRTILEELDQNIVTASSGEEALRWLLDHECAVILLDVNMPGMDGLETAELIRSRRKTAHTPIIFITAFADEMHTARGYSLGAVDYILSPVVPNILRSKVKALVQLHRLNAELKRRSDERVALVREQAARTMAEESQRRASFLAEATQVMASSLDVDTILKGGSTLLVPFLADYAAVMLAGEDGSVRARRSSSVAGWEHYLGQARAGFESLLAEMQMRALHGASHEVAAALAPPSVMEEGESPAGEVHAFPLVTRGKARGALLLALGPSGRRLVGQDLSLAENLAGRVASALENCLLYEEIQQADRRKNEFLATLSHELRNPLAPMRSALHMLKSQPVEPDKMRALVDTMDRQVGQMTRLVEDLLDISRITRGVIELRHETLEVGAELRNAVESCRGAIDLGHHQIEMRLPPDPVYVVADRVRLQQVLENVILNAVKYTNPGGRIEVFATGELSDAVIQVKDNGIGIAPEKLQQVWDLFVQVDDSPERARKGLGIGLALVRDLVKRHGGSVEACSEGLGRGSTFTLRFPRAVRHDMETKQMNSIPPAERPVAGAVKRVLIVDDNVDAAETLAMMLELLGQQTRQAHEGNNALTVAQEYQPDVIFMDIGLPGLSGHEVVTKMRNELGMTTPYIIALSGYGTEEDRRKSFKAGFDNHLVKPLDPSALPGLLELAERRAA
ncbi:MAG TPA: response regulator [Usitatibacter sp.]|jgi:signal transduction histidine kinase/DNA-binding response OmpR family regulator|nr:response regulator [Usitatibacter sp.]